MYCLGEFFELKYLIDCDFSVDSVEIKIFYVIGFIGLDEFW